MKKEKKNKIAFWGASILLSVGVFAGLTLLAVKMGFDGLWKNVSEDGITDFGQ